MFMEKTVKELTEKSDNLAKKVLEWTEKTYDWKQRAEDAERKLKEAGGDQEVPAIDAGEDPQGMFLQAAMEKGKKATGERYLPKKARESLSDKEYARSTAKKRAAMRKGQQHSKQPDDVAKKTARHRR